MTDIKVPPLGESIVEATVARWLKNEGDAIAPGDTLVELETDKITVEVPAITGGVLAKRAHGEGDVVKVGDLLAVVDESAKSATPAPERGAAPAHATAEAAASPPPAVGIPATTPAPAAVGGPRVSPAAQRLAAEQGVAMADVRGTGRGGVISKADIIEQASPREQAPRPEQAPTREQASTGAPAPRRNGAPAPAAPARARGPEDGQRETREKLTTRRKRIAEHLLEAQHATAHLTTFNEIDMSTVSALRDRLRERIEKRHGVKLTFMSFFVKAACLALQDHPTVNALLDGDTLVYHHYVNMGIAVASDAGLVVPNVKDADQKTMVEVSREIAEVAKRARDGKLTMDDLTGGTFTITNGGVFGSLVSTPILNYPQVGILGLHKIQDRPVVVEGAIVIRPMMYVALSYDHRVIDGQQAVLFLVRVKELMEDPASMLVE